MNPWTFTLFSVGAGLGGWFWWRSRARQSEIRRIAEQYGFHYSGEVLPPSLPLRDLPFLTITSVWNVIDGERGGRRVVAFDCRFGEGKGSWRRTVIAVRANRAEITASSFDLDIQIEQVADWTVLYRPHQLALISRQLTPISELAAYLESI
jgi:hypothetical protein